MDQKRLRLGFFEVEPGGDMACNLKSPCHKKKECVICAALDYERTTLKYIRPEHNTLAEVIITKFAGQFTISEDGLNWKEEVATMCKCLGEERELRKTLSKLGGQSLSKAEVLKLARTKELSTVYVEGKELGKNQVTPEIAVFRATVQKEAIIYWEWVEQNLGDGGCPQNSTEVRSELIRAILGLAWLQTEVKGFEWAGDMTILYELLQKEIQKTKHQPSFSFATITEGEQADNFIKQQARGSQWTGDQRGDKRRYR